MNCQSLPHICFLTRDGSTLISDNGFTLISQLSYDVFDYFAYRQFGGKENVEKMHREEAKEKFFDNVYKPSESEEGRKDPNYLNDGVINLERHAQLLQKDSIVRESFL